MKRLGDAAAAAVTAAKHRTFHWCRRHNGFADMPTWRVIARMTQLPLYQIVAFVSRLEELANQARPRGYVGDFSAEEFAAALDMPVEHAARIYAALEDSVVGWIDQDTVVSFYERNPDQEDRTAAQRKQRQRARAKAMRELAEAFRHGKISAEERRRLEIELLADARLSTGHGGHIVTPRDIVTVTADQITNKDSGPVDNSGPGEVEQAGAGVAEQWLANEGRRIVAERMQEGDAKAEQRIARWLRDLDDAAALVVVLKAADEANYMAGRFHNLVVDLLRRQAHKQQPALPLGPVPAAPAKRGAADG